MGVLALISPALFTLASTAAAVPGEPQTASPVSASVPLITTLIPAAPDFASLALNVIGLANTFLKYVAFDIFYKVMIGWMLPLKSRGGYWACCLAMQATGYLVLISNPTIPVRLAWYIADYALVPYLWWDAPRRIRIIAAAFSVVGELFTEIACMAFYSVFGLGLTEQGTNNPLELVARLGTMALFGGIVVLVRRIFSTRLSLGPENHSHPAAQAPRHAHTDAYLAFFVVQATTLALFYIVFFNNGTQEIPLAWAIGTLTLTVACIVSDVVAIRSLQRYLRARRERERADALTRELSVHTRAARALAVENEHATRFRHDARNHLQTLGALIERGGTDRAQAYLGELRHHLNEPPCR